MKKNNALIIRHTTFQSVIEGPGNEKELKMLGCIVVASNEQPLPEMCRRISRQKTKSDKVFAGARE